jgi:hypothetical protein
MADFDQMVATTHGRRAFLSRLGILGVSLGVTSLVTVGCGNDDNNGSGGFNGNNGNGSGNGVIFADPTNFPGIRGRTIDEVVFNFALTLEFLEADLYRQALNLASGRATSAPLEATPASYALAVPDGGLGVKAAAGFEYLRQYAFVEKAHADFLVAAIPTLGGTPVSPNPAGYQAAFGTTLASILTVIRTLEEEGVRAYLGAAGFLTTLPLIQLASTIYSTEARHSAAVNYALGLDVGPAMQAGDLKVTPTYPHADTFEYFRTPSQVLTDIQPFLRS